MEAPEDFPRGMPQAVPSDGPDIMNDPAYETNTHGKENSPEDVDTCRICRAEGSKDEELFYPCKCSGSIKFVHQNCLMDWLSHSQKKHCELCKTPFRFTKLYDAHMPKSVPFPVFLRQALIHTWKSFVTWSRFHLVAFVWVFWLPWCMRSVWRGLFWIGDGGWVDGKKRSLQDAAVSLTDPGAAETTARGASTFPSSREELASVLVSHISERLPRSWNPWSKVFGGGGEPFTFRLIRKVYHIVVKETVKPSSVAVGDATPVTDPNARSPSWLSKVPVLGSLTRSKAINNLLIDTLEGQMITIAVVVAFILIFLIREWVMQQQQNMLLGPEGNHNVPLPANAVAEGQNDEGTRPNEAEDPTDAVRAAFDNEVIAQQPEMRRLARPRRRLQRRVTLPDGQFPNHIDADNVIGTNREGPDSTGASATYHLDFPNASLEAFQRPPMPDRGVIAQAIEIRRTLDERARGSPDRNHSGAKVFKDLWARAHEDPSVVLRLIQEEDRMEELDWIVTFMRRLEGASANRKIVAASDVDRKQPPKAHSDDPISDVPDCKKSLIPVKDTSSLEPQGHSSPPVERPYVQRGKSDSALSMREPEHSKSEVGAEARQQLASEISSYAATPGDLDAEPGHDRIDNEAILSPGQEQLQPQENVADGTAAEATLRQSHNIWERIVDAMWGGVVPAEEPLAAPAVDEEHVVNDIANEAPFVPVNRQQALMLPQDQGAEPAQDPEVIAAAAQAGLDPNGVEAMDDIEDLEGVMELIGMHGPLVGLVQNGMFCALLVALTITVALWVPYMFGKIFLTMIDQPMQVLKQPLRLASTSADMIVDVSIFAAGCSFYWIDTFFSTICAPLSWLIPPLVVLSRNKLVPQTAKEYAGRALERLASASIVNGDFMIKAFDIPKFSVVAHESLYHLEDIALSFRKLIHNGFVEAGSVATADNGISSLLAFLLSKTQKTVWFLGEASSRLLSLTPSLLRMNPLRFSLARAHRTAPFDYTLAAWSSKDRFIAIVCGYLFFALLGVLYLYLAEAIQGANKKGRVENGLAEILYQAGGVTKVVLIISIEMIVFPLYCGCLLDIAMLPLFGSASPLTRLQFTVTYPWTSLFIHWFVGTCYMFHFALFVSMCRKVLRTGVLFFIRDPDDPTFHPVRDVLERNVRTQLWKISFSALVYGVLVLSCLGGVVWGIAFAIDGVFPIQWSSTEPVLEFPVDLLFYNFLMPLAVKFFKPSDGLTKMYGWWFRKCARLLRLTDFLFGEKMPDEQGRHVRRSWSDIFRSKKGDPFQPVTSHDGETLMKDRNVDVYFLRDGRFVDAPASDQVRIQRGKQTYIEAPEDDEKFKQFKESPEYLALQRTPGHFTKVYIPPHFRLRTTAFVFLVWLFAATTGILSTVGPLLFGRYLFTNLMPGHVRMNDIYSFSAGVYILGGSLYLALNFHRVTPYIRRHLTPHSTTITDLARKGRGLSLRALGLLYTYLAFTIFLPALISLVIQCFLLIPLHTYISSHATGSSDTSIPHTLVSPQSNATSLSGPTTTPADLSIPRPIIHLIQDWTLGLLYLKVIGRLILWSAPSRPATALRSIIRHGWLYPDVRLATRGFILPATIIVSIILLTPLAVGWMGIHTVFAAKVAAAENSGEVREQIYRYSYPALMAALIVGIVMLGIVQALGQWRKRVRDEVYLIGERLHNYGEAKRKGKDVKGKGKEKTERPLLEGGDSSLQVA